MGSRRISRPPRHATQSALFNGAAMAVCYLAAEPYARRLRPRLLVTWSRLVAGRLRDSLVGLHLLIGTVAGLMLVKIGQADSLLSMWLVAIQPLPKLPTSGYALDEMLGVRFKIGTLMGTLINAVLISFILLVCTC
jgi:hypothetical protein